MAVLLASVNPNDPRAFVIVTGNGGGQDTTYELGIPDRSGMREIRRNGKLIQGKLAGVVVASVEEATHRLGGKLLATQLQSGGYAIPADISVGDCMAVEMPNEPHSTWTTRPVKSIEAL